MKFLKKSSLGLISFMCMIVIVSYINYEYNEEREKNLGKTVYVSTNEGDLLKFENENNENGYLYKKSLDKNEFLKIKEDIQKIENKLNEMNYDFLVSFDTEKMMYIIYLNNKDVEKENLKKVINENIGIDFENFEINVLT